MRPAIYKNYFLLLLLTLLAFNFVDRLILGLVLQDIKIDLQLSDTQLGLMTGIAFALFYSVMGIPIARWADRGNRVTIISLTAALWSVMVALCGMAGSFVQLLLIRVGAGIGEAGCIPPAHSLIADYFPRAERARAAALYALGGPLSFVIGYFGAGWLNELYGWRVTFMLLGPPGLVLAALAWFTLREPRRKTGVLQAAAREPAESTTPPPTQPSLREVCVTLWVNVTFRRLLFAFSLMHFFGYGLLQWQPTFFIRSFGLKTGELGTWFAIIYGLGGMVGTYLGGVWASRHAIHNERLQLKMMAASKIIFGMLSVSVYLSTNPHWAFGLLALACVAGYWIFGPFFAVIQTLVPQRMRAMSIALIYLFANLIGMGLGPLAAGVLSDALRPWAGEESLRYTLLSLTPGYCWVAWLLWRASQTVARDLADSQANEDSAADEKQMAVHSVT